MVHHGFWGGPTMFHLLIAHMRGHSYMWAPIVPCPVLGHVFVCCLRSLDCGGPWIQRLHLGHGVFSLHPLDIG